SKLPLDSAIGTASPKSHAIGIACLPKMCRGHSAIGSHAQIEQASSDSLDSASARGSESGGSAKARICLARVNRLSFCRALKSLPHSVIPYRWTRKPSVPIGGNDSFGIELGGSFDTTFRAL